MSSLIFKNAVSLIDEMVSFETLWGQENASQKRIASLFSERPGLPSQVLKTCLQEHMFLVDLRERVSQFVSRLTGFSVSLNRTIQYPSKLRDAEYPIELFYYRGFLGLAETPSVSVVGARKASPEGIARASRLAKELVTAGFTVVSGLAAGIDTAAMTSAINAGGRTIGVIGTPINESYPKQNSSLQERVAAEHLLISQVPFYRYAHQPFQTKRHYFPQRNETMAALSDATVIVEASDTSGSLTQARAAIKQKRKLFILNSCFENPSISWPEHYAKLGAIRIRQTEDVIEHLKN